ncbi:MAG: FAD-dependent thymidylate synthase [Nitrospirae bacterium]|nr:MAG: FAD-dependent thymidylate synthase [Nitrospirota bacterium]
MLPALGDTLGLVTLHPVLRAAQQARVTFATRLSHTADSQNQRHRMVPGARPALSATVDDEPDYVTPSLIAGDGAALRAFRQAMDRAWEAFSWLRRHAPAPHLALYLLPNAVAVRIVETADLAALQHKMRMRLCWNAQEEIRRIAWEQAVQLREADPLIGGLMLPPCGLRHLAGTTPYCPEGDRYCGVPVWRLPFEEQEPPPSR